MTALQQLGQRLFSASLENDARWRAFVAAADNLRMLVRQGIVDRQIAGEWLRDAGRHYFEDDPQSRFSIDCVIRAFAHGTRINKKAAAV
jgi:hypothetical protein